MNRQFIYRQKRDSQNMGAFVQQQGIEVYHQICEKAGNNSQIFHANSNGCCMS